MRDIHSIVLAAALAAIMGCDETPVESVPAAAVGTEAVVEIGSDAVIVAESVPKFEPVSGFGDAAAMAAKIEEVIGEPLGDSAVVDGSSILAETAHFTVKVDTERGRFAIVGKDEFPVVESDDTAPYEEVYVAAESALNTLGVTDAETAHAADLNGQFKEIGGAAGEPVALARTVFVDRTMGGVPVVGDRLVVDFGMDGSFRGLHGRWTPVDVVNSTFAVDLGADEIEALVQGEVSASDSPDPVLVRTVLVPDGIESLIEDAEPYPRAVHLAWEVGVQTYGPDGPSFVEWRIVRPPVEAEEVGR